MKIRRPPHNWNVSPQQAIVIQRKLAARVERSGGAAEIRLVAGTDAAFSRDGRACIAGVVLWDMQERQVVERHIARAPLRFPYIPGLLTFREAPAILAALRRLDRAPDLLLCDGQGIAHPRRIGIASHLGVIIGLPAAGCAKSRLVGTYAEPGPGKGSCAPLLDRGEIIGSVVRTRDRVKPVFVSIGHRVDLPTAERIVLACAIRYRLPEPTRLADQLVSAYRRQMQ